MIDLARGVLLTHTPSPFRAEWRRLEVPASGTVAEMLAAAGIETGEGTIVALNGERLDDLGRVPEPGDTVSVVGRPGDPISVGSAIITALAELGVGATVATIGGIIITAGVYYGLYKLATMGQVKPPEAEGDAGGSRTSVSDTQNRFARYETLPYVLGVHKFAPPHAAAPYIVAEGGQLFQYTMFCFGPGTLQLSDLRIGVDPIFKESTTIVYTGTMTSDSTSGKDANGKERKRFPDMTLEIRQGTATDAAMKLYTDDVVQQTFGFEVTHARGWIVRRTVPDTIAFSVVISFPVLFRARDSGKQTRTTVRMLVEYRLASAAEDDEWTEVTRLKMTGGARSSFHFTREVTGLTAGEYDVRVKRVTGLATLKSGVQDQSYWASMNSTRAGTPVTDTEVCLVAIKARITNSLPNGVTEFSAIASRVCPDWNGAAWADAVTSNPASLYRHVLMADANLRAVAASRIDDTALQTWHGETVTNGYTYNSVIFGGTRTVFSVLAEIAAAGRASFDMADDLFSVVRDLAVTTPIQHITPRNSWGFNAVRVYPEMPDGFRVEFIDASQDYLLTEIIVPRTGYTKDTATTLELLRLPGVTTEKHAYALGRYWLLVLENRPDQYVVNLDYEYLNLARGDDVKVNHDVAQFGLDFGRVKSLTLNGSGDLTAVGLDSDVTMAAASYVIRFRKTDGSAVTSTVQTVAGENSSVTLQPKIDVGNPMPEVGDLFQFGESGGEAVDMKVVKILPGDQFSATVVLEDAAPAVLVTTTKTPTVPAVTFGRGKPEKPRVDRVRRRRGRGGKGGFRVELGDPAPSKMSGSRR